MCVLVKKYLIVCVCFWNILGPAQDVEVSVSLLKKWKQKKCNHEIFSVLYDVFDWLIPQITTVNLVIPVIQVTQVPMEHLGTKG